MADTQQAGPKALNEIRDKVAELLETLDNRTDSLDSDDPQTHEQTVSQLMSWLVRRYEGSYQWGGHDGWKTALENPTEPAFDPKNW